MLEKTPSNRTQHLKRFYDLLAELEQRVGGTRKLSQCDGRMGWPQRGVYFFHESGESRADTGTGLRVVRVGTHALKDNAKTSLWQRLSGHKGTAKFGGGNHRGSIFRLLVGTALIKRDGLHCPTWGKGNSAPRHIREGEQQVERAVSDVIGAMPFLWLDVDDAAGPESLRGYIERNVIALLSNWQREPLDAPSRGWLGHHCNRERVRGSGLWNQNHVEESYDPEFLDTLEMLVHKTTLR